MKRYGSQNSTAYFFVSIMFFLAAAIDRNFVYAICGVCLIFLGSLRRKRERK
ncbi:MAG: hypothetical protein Q4A66_00400 [Eubacteriales bacterium]|nr:hypothetical protein [Eubacteriales bacterium]